MIEPIIARNWWAFVLRGVFAIIFGVVAVVWPGLTIGALVLLFGAYALVDGIFAVISAVRDRGENWVVFLILGVLGILFGLFVLGSPLFAALSALALVYTIGFWAIAIGVIQVVGAIQLRREISNEFLLILSGILSVLVGLFLVVFPGDGALALIWVIGIYAIVFGVMLVVLGFNLRGRAGRESGAITRSV